MFWCFPIVPIALSIAAYWNGWKERSFVPLAYVPAVWVLGAVAQGSASPSFVLAVNMLSIILSLTATGVLLWMAYSKPKPKPAPRISAEKHKPAE